ncbi:MAG: PQQ-binding-like beta-propeller repeat protein [Spirochaetes bacterium]|nr:PQQ-binding-like beta-propeller repeat protein [Spirochaetota bacterium]
MGNIDNLLKKLNKSDIRLPDRLYENISEGVRRMHEQRNKRAEWFYRRRPAFKYALTFIVLFFIGIYIFSSTRISMEIVSRKGTAAIIARKNKPDKTEKKISIGSYLVTEKGSDIKIRLGEKLSFKLMDDNILQITKMKKFAGYEGYGIHVEKGRQTYVITKGANLNLSTEHIRLQNLGTIFELVSDERGTYIKVLKGKVSLRRNIKNIPKIKTLRFSNDSDRDQLETIFQKKNIIKMGESVYVRKDTNNKIDRMIQKIVQEKRSVANRDLSALKREFYIEKKAGASALWKYDTGSPIWVSPAVLGGEILIGTESGNIVSLSKKGKLNWEIKTGSAFFNNGSIHEKRFYIVDSKGALYCVDTDGARVIWKKQVGEVMYSRPLRTYGSLFVATASGEIKALQPDTGKVIWQKKLWNGIFCEPITERGKIYFGSEDGTVFCINYFNAAIEWKKKTDGRIAVSSPSIYQKALYFGNNKGFIHALDLSKGSLLWRKKLSGKILSRPLIQNDSLFVATSAGTVYSMTLNGKIKWKLDLNENIETSFEIAGNEIIIPGKKGNVYIIDKARGAIKRIINIEEEIISKPVVESGFLYIATMKGNVYKYSIREDSRIAGPVK